MTSYGKKIIQWIISGISVYLLGFETNLFEYLRVSNQSCPGQSDINIMPFMKYNYGAFLNNSNLVDITVGTSKIPKHNVKTKNSTDQLL